MHSQGQCYFHKQKKRAEAREHNYVDRKKRELNKKISKSITLGIK